VSVVVTATVRFDYQARISPEEIGLQPLATHKERRVDLGMREIAPIAHAKEEALQLAAGPFGFGVKFVENHAKPGDPTTTAAPPDQLAQGNEINETQNLRLGDRSSQLPHRNHSSQIEESSLNGGAGDPA
jgi:hypothetical protein